MFSTFAAWRRYHESVRELSRLSDRQLDDIGIERDRIASVARIAPAMTRDDVDALVRARASAMAGDHRPLWSDADRLAGTAARA